MKNKNCYILTLLTCLLLTLAACGGTEDSDSSEVDIKNDENEEEQSSGEELTDIEASSILDFESQDISELPNDPVKVDNSDFPSHGNYPAAHNGTFILTGNSSTHFYNYKEGKMSDFDLNGHGDPRQDTSSLLAYLFDDYFYTIEGIGEYGKDDKFLVEINVVTGEKKTLLDVENDNYLMEKKDDILYLENEENLIALDTTTEDEMWSVDTDSNFYFHSAYTTDNTILLLGDEGLAVYSLEDGDKIYETEGYFFDAVADNESFYVMEKSEETLLDHDKTIYNILKFGEQEEEGELLFTAPAVTETYELEDTNIDIHDDTLFLKAPYALLAYDTSSGDFLWATSLDGDIEKDHIDDKSYDFRTAYQDGKVYSRITAWDTGAEESLFTVLDAKTGEMKENYQVGRGEGFGPVVDGEKAIILHRDDDGYQTSFILD